MSDPVSRETLLGSFPYPLKGTPEIYALAMLAAGTLGDDFAGLPALDLYGRIDELPDALLDTIAYDLKVDWWDADAPLDVKRRVLLSAWTVKRGLGSVGAVNRAIGDVYEGASVQDWYDYGGKPYHYRLQVDLGETAGGIEVLEKLRRQSKYYVNARSVLDGVVFATERIQPIRYGTALLGGDAGTFRVAGL